MFVRKNGRGPRVSLDEWINNIMAYAPEVAEQAYWDIVDQNETIRPLPDIAERRQTVRRMYLAGASYDDIKKAAFCSRTTVWRDLVAMGLPRRRKP